MRKRYNSAVIMEAEWIIDSTEVAQLFDIQFFEKNDFENVFTIKRREIERRAEKEGYIQHKIWTRDKVSLEAAIDDALKDHVELHRSAHAVRLQLEQERNDILREAQIRSLESARRQNISTTTRLNCCEENNDLSYSNQSGFEYFVADGEETHNCKNTDIGVGSLYSLQKPGGKRRYKAPSQVTS